MRARGTKDAANGCRAFTLIELLLVIAIMGLLMGLVLTGLSRAQSRGKVLKARRDIAQLKTALSAYYADYSQFPNIGSNSRDSGYIVTGEDVVQILRGRENHNGQNPKRRTYMDFHASSTRMLDPWENRYRIAMDTNYVGEVSVPGGVTLRMGVAAWSAGPDGSDGTDDDVRSWRE